MFNFNIKHLLFSSVFCLCVLFSNATHFRAGEIIYKNLSLNKYEIIVYTYTDQGSRADPFTDKIILLFGDQTSQVVKRSNGDGEIINSSENYGVKKNEYRTVKTYNGPGTYMVSFEEPNRVDKILNINEGVTENLAFSLTAFIVVGGNSFFNKSPILTTMPIDRGCKGSPFVHNPSAYDPDGDSLVFEIQPPSIAPGVFVPEFSLPSASDSFTINRITGQLTWQKPQRVGIYNIVIRVKEYRKGNPINGKPFLVGYVDRDMQIKIEECLNTPPIINNLTNECVVVGNLLEKNITTFDNDKFNGLPRDQVTLSYYGGPFIQKYSPAFTSPSSVVGNPTSFLFSWKPACQSIRFNEFQADFKAEDNFPFVPLADYKNFRVKVLGPPIKNVVLKDDSNGIKVSWDVDSCNFAFGYNIYRRIDSSFWNPAKCETGVPAYTGFSLQDTTQGLNNNLYFDNNFGVGLSPLINYCYRITSFYLARDDNGSIVDLAPYSEGKSSIEVCAIIKRTKPLITNVSVQKTDANNGAIYVKWIRPTILDTVKYLPPYTFRLKRAIKGSNDFTNVGIARKYASFYLIQNDSLLDSLLNTENIQYNYKVVFNYSEDNFLNESIEASSVFLNPYNTDRAIVLNYNEKVPWMNNEYIIYRQNGNVFDSIGYSNTSSYTDTGLVNGVKYCYYVKSKGKYVKNELFNETLLNNSQIACGIPVDTIPPCAPIVTFQSPCEVENLKNIILNWSYPKACKNDVETYQVYYKKEKTNPWTLLTTLPGNITAFTDTSEMLKYSISGCYSITAKDTTGNESRIDTNEFCIENCPYYVLPNVFSPNGDKANDLFKPFPYKFINSIEIKILNRWSNLVFETNNIDINWDGKDQSSGNNLPDGVYFYTLKVYENYLGGTVVKNKRGTITLLRGK